MTVMRLMRLMMRLMMRLGAMMSPMMKLMKVEAGSANCKSTTRYK